MSPLLLTLLWAAGLAAQQTPPPATPSTAAPPPAAPEAAPAETAIERPMEEQIVVTGSRIRRKDLTTPAPVTVLTREQFQQSGKLTIGDFLQSLPEQGNAPNFQVNTGGVNYGADSSTRISLRSLGVTRTLVLVNGRRQVPGGLGASSSVDLNSIPSAAVERIEVLKDGASAVYGSDAIAGVVNIITRRGFNGTEVGAQYGVSQHGDAQTFEAHATTGRSDERSSLLFSLGYFDQKDSWLRDRDWSKQALDFDYTAGGAYSYGSHRTPQGDIQFKEDPSNPGKALCNGNGICLTLTGPGTGWTPKTYYIRDPNSALGWRKTIEKGQPNDFYNFASENYLSIPSTSWQAYSSGDAKFTPARGYYEMSFVYRKAQQNAAPSAFNPSDYPVPGGTDLINVSKDSYYNPFRTDLPFAGRRLVEFGHRTYAEDLSTFRLVTGLDGQLPQQLGPLQGWYWDASMNYGRTSGTFTTNGAQRNSKVADSVGPSMLNAAGLPVCVKTAGDLATVIPGCVPIDLFHGPGSITAAQLDYLGFTGTSRAFDALFTAGANVSGDLIQLAADRPVSLALGYEFRRQSGAQIADPIAASGDSSDFNFKSTQGFFTAHEAFAELSLPLLSNVQGVQSLEGSVAGRYVNYSTFGGNFTYKLGARYTPVQDFTLRGTYSTAFRAPTISELYLGATETDPNATDPCGNLIGASQALKDQCTRTGVTGNGSGDGGSQELTHVGGNPNLRAETARVITGGLVIQPRMVRNLSITVDYYNTTIDDAVGTIGTATIIAGCYRGDAGPSNQAYCDLIHRINGRIFFVDDINQNIGKIETSGIDFAIRYALPTDLGRFGFAFDANWLAAFDRTSVLATGNVTVHGKGNYDLGTEIGSRVGGALPAIKANLGVNWTRSGLAAGVIARYIGNFKECANPTDYTTAQGGLCNVNDSGQTVVPARQVGYNIVVDLNGGYTWSSSFGRTSFLAGINNVFNQAPQYIYSAALANSDPAAYDYLGRYVYGRVQHQF
jgi:outer membrane receptor protein involved in Fe transport